MEEFIEAYNKDIDISKVCRTCLTDHGEMISLAVKHGNVHFSAIDVLESFTLLKFEMNSTMPSNICRACYKFIDEVNRFKLRCIRIDSTLRECINLQRNNKEFEVLDINKKQSVKISNNMKKLVSNAEVKDSECNVNCSDLDVEDPNWNYNSDDEILSKKREIQLLQIKLF